MTTKQFNLNIAADEVYIEEEIAIQTRPIRMRKFCLFLMSKRYAFGKNNNLENRRIAVLQLILATFIMLKGESDL